MGIYWSNMFTICKINLSFLNIVTLNCVLSDPLGGIWLILFEVNTYHTFMHTLLKTIYIPVPLAHPVWSEHIPYIHAHPIKTLHTMSQQVLDKFFMTTEASTIPEEQQRLTLQIDWVETIEVKLQRKHPHNVTSYDVILTVGCSPIYPSN